MLEHNSDARARASHGCRTEWNHCCRKSIRGELNGDDGEYKVLDYCTMHAQAHTSHTHTHNQLFHFSRFPLCRPLLSVNWTLVKFQQSSTKDKSISSCTHNFARALFIFSHFRRRWQPKSNFNVHSAYSNRLKAAKKSHCECWSRAEKRKIREKMSYPRWFDGPLLAEKIL